jgi:hypothetical protein
VKREEVEAIFDDRELGPIEPYLEEVAIEERVPALAIGMCLLRMEEAAPPLRALLARAAAGEYLTDDESMLLFRGVYILGGARDTPSCQSLLRLLRRPEVDDLLGDAVTEGMARIVAGVFDGDVDALSELILDGSVDPFVRDALLGAATFLTWKGSIARDRMKRLLQDFFERRLAVDDGVVWAGWMNAIALLGLRDMVPPVERAREEAFVGDWDMLPEDFEEILSKAEQKPDDASRFEEFDLGYIEDVTEALAWSDVTDTDVFDESFDDEVFERENPEPLWTPTEPVRNPWRNVGRNDPCPCGSGKKAKKCCLANKS